VGQVGVGANRLNERFGARERVGSLEGRDHVGGNEGSRVQAPQALVGGREEDDVGRGVQLEQQAESRAGRENGNEDGSREGRESIRGRVGIDLALLHSDDTARLEGGAELVGPLLVLNSLLLVEDPAQRHVFCSADEPHGAGGLGFVRRRGGGRKGVWRVQGKLDVERGGGNIDGRDRGSCSGLQI